MNEKEYSAFQKNLSGYFIMGFSDFRKIFDKIFICVDLPSNFLGLRYYDSWTINESGGIPTSNTSEEFENFAKNPQYYISIKNPTLFHISICQRDGT